MTDQSTAPDPEDEAAAQAVAQAEGILADAAQGIGDGMTEAEGLDAEAQEVGDDIAQAEARAAEHLADLQRLQAEYVNYRKRVDRDRFLAGDTATARAVEALIPALDDIAAARDHGDLADGPFAAIAEKLETALARLGWSAYGVAGEPFDPALHEALTTQADASVSEPVILQVAQVGHRLGDKVLRPARVVVAQPE